uniref:Phosphoinositide phospholipase C n=1 Tax=Cyprinus carpio TaxID=7962 RepID=A0A8C2KVA5_CYPCA
NLDLVIHQNLLILHPKCMSSMQTGTQMVKLRGGSKGLVRFFYLDEHKSCIRWRPSRKNEKAKISIDSIREVCEGKQSEIFQRYADGSFDPNCCFSIYYGEHMASLDLVSGTGEEARTWITGLKYLMAGISDEDSLAKPLTLPITWLKQTFTEADKNGDGCLSISEVLQLLHKLNVNLPRQKVKQMFKEADTDDNQGTLGFEEFCSFYKMMSTRRDLYLLMLTYSNHKDHLDTDDLKRFLETEQKMTNVSKEHCLEIVAKFEPCPENQTLGVLGIDGFTNYMRSPAGDIFNPEHYEVNQDMTQPLSNYFIASSHNTYLMGDQLMSQSRVDMYAWVLQAGCRCVEVDCWDGQDGEPIVHHGYTLTSKILFKDVIETINKYAFIKTQFPVILSIENHCSVPQQKKMAQYLTEVFGDKLDMSSIPADPSGLLPSPEALKGKILIKGKKLPPNIDENAEEGDVSDEDSADEMEDDCKLMNGDVSIKKLDNLMKESKIRDREDPDSFTIAALPPTGKHDKSPLKVNMLYFTHSTFINVVKYFMSVTVICFNRKKKTMKLSRALSDLVYTKSVGTPDFEAQGGSSGRQVSSMSETKAHQLMQQKPVQFMQFNQSQLSRIYPSPYRVDSSNFNPQPFWNAGCHLVALNYQTEGRVLQLNRAKFYCNGNCGYILKPACMCEGSFNPVAEDPLPGRLKKQLVLKIISGQQLPKPKDSMLGDRGEIIDPFVEVEIIGLPVDCCKEQTRVVDDNGFNPMWEETLVFTLHMPEIALIRFLVWDHDPIGQDFIGQRTIAFNSMIPGYRHVYLEGMEEASIFVHVAVNDITSKVSTSWGLQAKKKMLVGIKGLFHRNPKQASLDSHAAALLNRKSTFGAHLLRRTASAPTKGQPKVKRGFPEISIDTKDSVTDPNNPEIKTRQTETDAVKETTATQSSQMMQELKGVFDRDIGQSMQTGLRTPVRRTKSEGQMKAVIKTDGPSVVPEVSIDATLNDRLWSKLDPSSHRDSVSSSSSISSNDTVIDLSLPNLSRKSLTCLSAARDYSDNQVSLANRTSQPRSTIVARNVSLVSKSKSNPNLRDGEMCEPEDELQPRPLAAEKDPIRPMQRRHTWSRLYMEGLKQSSTLAASAGSKRSTIPSAKDMDSSSKSKSLGDLTSDDIVCHFESKYRSISRSFIVRPSRQLGKTLRKPQNDLTEQLKRLTDVEPLTSKDFAQCRNDSERQRLQSLTRTSGSPIEERGNPEGACSVAHSPCVSLDLLSQLPPGPPQQSPLSPDNEIFFMLRL